LQYEKDGKAAIERENPYRIMVENAPDAIVVHRDGKFLYANSAALLLLGADDFAQLASHTILDFFRQEEREQAAVRMRAILELPSLPIREARLRRLDGKEITVEFHTRAIDFQSARAVQTIVYDISEHKRAEEEIRSLARFPSENPNPVLRVASDGRIIYANIASKPLLTTWRCKVEDRLPDEWVRHVSETFAAKAIREVEVVCDENCIISCILAPIPEAGYVNIYGRDVTEFRQAEKALRENEARFRLVLDRSPVIVAQVDRDLCYTWIYNPVDGRRPADIVGKKIGIFTDPEITERTRRMLGEVVTKGTSAQWETTLSTSVGDRDYQSYAEPLRGDQGTIIGASLVFIDITERKEREKQIDRLTHLYSVLSRVNETIVRTHDETSLYREVCRIVAEEGRFPLVWIGQINGRQVNPIESCGPERDYLDGIRMELDGDLGKGPTGTCIRENRPIVNDDFAVNPATLPWQKRALLHGFRASAAFPLRLDGKVVSALTLYASEPGSFDVEQVKLLESLSADISFALDALEDGKLRARAEQALRNSESKYRNLFENLTEEVHFWRLVRNEKGLIETWRLADANPPALNTWGKSLAEIAGKTADEIFGPGATKHYMPVVEKIISEGVPCVCEDYFPNLDKHFRFTNIPLGEYFIVTGADITGIKKAQVVLEARVKERTAELEKRAMQLRALALELARAEDRERRRLAQVLHDDLQQMLVAAKFTAATALMGTTSTKVQESLKQVKDLLSRSIDASRSLTSELSPPILYDAGLAEALRWLGRWMKEKHGLTVDSELDDGIVIPQDERVLLFRAARELLFNVSKHARVERAKLRLCFPAGDRVQIEVEDHGIGYDPALQNAGGKMAGGFGLFSIRERLEWLGGCLEIDAAPNRGTRVTVVLPVALDRSQKTRNQVRSKSESVQAGPIRVLLVDDHRIVREGLAQLLSGIPDIRVIGEAEDGHMAVDLARRLQPDVVVMDVSMPNMTGIEATRLIKTDLSDCRVIGLSMHQSADMESSMREAGASIYLAKDGPSEVLIKTIRGEPIEPA
jgi:PAS domain S-box-containing protein